MKNASKFLVILGIMTISNWSFSQELNKKEVGKYAFMVGEWEGTGSAMNQQRQQETFTVHEVISFDVDSTVITMKGRGLSAEGKKVHNALATLYYDPTDSKVKLHSFIMQGMNTIANIEIIDENNFKWWFDVPNGGKMEYFASFTETTWKEKGQYITPDGQAYPTVSMDLKRIK